MPDPFVRQLSRILRGSAVLPAVPVLERIWRCYSCDVTWRGEPVCWCCGGQVGFRPSSAAMQPAPATAGAIAGGDGQPSSAAVE